MAKYSCKKFFPTTERLAKIHQRRTDDRRTTTIPKARLSLKYGRLKTFRIGLTSCCRPPISMNTWRLIIY